MPTDGDALARELRLGFEALTRGRLEDAAARCRIVLGRDPRRAEAHFLVALIALARDDLRTAVAAFGSVTRLDGDHVAAWAQLGRLFMRMGQPGRAVKALERATAIGSSDPVVQDLIGTVCSLLGQQHEARQWYGRAAAGAPQVVAHQINLAGSLIFLGDSAAAGAALSRALAASPGNPQAHWLVAGLERARDHRHIEEMQRLLDGATEARAVAFLAYGIGKECEDLEDWPAAFAAFERGARARRSVLEYDEDAEARMFAALGETFTPRWRKGVGPGVDDPSPIFVVGQPRTGTTLVERIITSHSMVHSAGELQQFALSVRRLAGVETRERFSAEIVRASAAIEPRALGEMYLTATRTARGEAPRFVDKLPANYLHLPLILAAFPRAKVVHVTRDAMDACFASYKQLFAEAYFHSYEQREMARHYSRYRRLMEHWRALLPYGMLDVAYEKVAADLEREARRLIAFLELPWEDRCLDFHRQSAAVATASAVQVREPVHTRSVGRWKRYRAELAPMQEELSRAGLS